MATYKNDIILIAGSGDFAYEAADFLISKGNLNHIIHERCKKNKDANKVINAKIKKSKEVNSKKNNDSKTDSYVGQGSSHALK